MIRWTRHHQFAPNDERPERERRMTWLASKDDRRKQTHGSFEKETGSEDIERLRRKVQAATETITDREAFLSGMVEASAKHELATFFTEDIQRKVLKTVFGETPGTAMKLERLMREDPEAARVKLEQLLGEKKRAEPGFDITLAAKLRQDEEAEKHEKKTKGPSRWERFLARIAELNDPRYTRLAALLANPAVQAIGMPSPREGFNVLRHMHELSPLGLVRKLTNTLANEQFLLRGPSEPEERLRALRDLAAFITHSLPDFAEHERAALHESLSDVHGAIIALEGDPRLWKKPENDEAQRAIEREYMEKHASLTRFLGREREYKEAKLHAPGGLVDRLKRAGGEDEYDAFNVLRKGFEIGGWIAELPVTDGEKEVCARITLTKIAALYRMIGIGKAAAPSSLPEIVSHIKRIFLDALRGEHAVAHAELLPVNEAKELKEEIERAIASNRKPPLAKVRRLRLLHAWLAHSNVAIDLPEEKIRAYERHAEASMEELRREARWRRDALRVVDPALVEANPEAWLAAMSDRAQERMFYESPLFTGDDELGAYLRSSCTAQQLTEIAKREFADPDATVGMWIASGAFPRALDDIQTIIRKHGIHPDPEELARQHAYAANEMVKRERRQHREAGVLQDSAHEAYLLQLNDINGKRERNEIVTDEWRMLLTDLNAAYDTDQKARQEIHILRLRSEMERLLEAIHAEIRLGVKEFGEEHGKRFVALLEEIVGSNRDAKKDAEKLLELTHLVSTILDKDAMLRDGLDALSSGTFVESADPLVQAQTNVRQLRGLARDQRSFRNDAEKEADRKREARERARRLNDARKGKRAHGAIGACLGECSRPDADITSAAVMSALKRTEQFRNAFEAMKKSEPRRLTRTRFEKEAERLKLPRTAHAMFDRKTCVIFVNEDRIAEIARKTGVAYEDVEELALIEERRHHFHELTRRLGSQSLLHNYRHIAFAKNVPEHFHDDIIALGRRWIRWQDGMTENEWRMEVADELLAKWEVFRRCREKRLIAKDGGKEPHVPLRDDEIAFFRMMEEHGIEPLPIVERTKDGDSIVEFARAAAALDTGDDGTDAAPRDGYVEGAPHAKNLREIQQFLVKIEAFLDANEDWAIADNRTFLEEKKEEYRAEQERFAADPHSESDKGLEQDIAGTRQALQKVWDVIAEYDIAQLDTRDAPHRVRGLGAIWQNIEWVSVSDIIAMYKAIKEDVTRQFQRRQQGKIGRVGERLTAWLGETPILKHIPYLQNLSSEFHRRDKHSEVEEVQKWQDALKDDDTYALQDMLREIRPGQRDKMKAILNLLAERGRIDWGDPEFWHSLNRLSTFEMPIGKCERDENLREEWLRKLIESIYGDKDLYRKWRNQNSSSIASEKNNFSPETDRLSNLSGGLSGELEKQLRIYLDVKARRERGEQIAMPSVVQPHLYEKVIHYSISNGKMSMEDKFYYLVQGIAHGLMSRDRLAVIAGEGGEGLLQTFPFIDYFYGKNNTKREIQSLAKRLWEGDRDHSLYCKPGLRTTLWLELEVARMDSVKQRLSKGFSKRGNEMDHDDMHFFLPRMDQRSLVQMTLPSGGGRPQFSPESWENGYVGFGSILKSLGMVAELEKDGIAGTKFTSEDATQAVQAVVNYLTIDSILTNRTSWGETGEGRQSKLERNRMRTRTPVVSNGRFTVMEAKDENDRVAEEILKVYGLLDKDPDIKEYVLYDAYGNELKDNKKTMETLKNLEKKLSEAIRSKGLEPLKQVLRKNKETLKTHAKNYTYETVKRLRMEQSRRAAAPALSA